MSIYLDYNASAPIDERVLSRMIEVYRTYIGNADSRTHEYGEAARVIVESARESVANLVGCNTDEVLFTSGATESNNIALQGLIRYANETGKKHILVSTIEHKAVLETAKAMESMGFEVSYISPQSDGLIDVKTVLKSIRKDTLIGSFMHVNNETGMIQPLHEIGKALADHDVLFHTDATQSFGKLVDEIKCLQYDMLSMSAHKIGGPQGIGALILRKTNYKLPPVEGVYHGGQQEKGIRPGTIPVALVAGLGKACEIVASEYDSNSNKCMEIKKMLITSLNDSGVVYRINGDQSHCISNTINISFSGVSSEALMLASRGLCGISNGSACNSNSYKPSYVLEAMGIESDAIESAVRISWGSNTDCNECYQAFQGLLSVVKCFSQAKMSVNSSA